MVMAMTEQVAMKKLCLNSNVRRLVIAARNVAFEDQPSREALKELDEASEAFAALIPWEDQPEGDAENIAPNLRTTCGDIGNLCSDCPPVGYSTDKTRCDACPRRAIAPHSAGAGK